MSEDILRRRVLDAAKEYFESAHAKTKFVPGKTYISSTGKYLDFSDLSQLLNSSLDLWLTTGPYTKKFEKKLSEFVGAEHPALFFNSGSSANLAAISSVVKPGDEVITSATTFSTTVSPIFQAGATPIFIDIDATTLNPPLENIKEALTPQTKGVVLPHTLGNPFRADQVRKWCDEKGLFLIEDCCDALGSKIGDRLVGTFGEFSSFSFYPAHHITTGEGGALVARNAALRRRAESLRDWGRDCWCETGKDNTCGKRFEWSLGDLPQGYDHKYIYSTLGYNLKATDLQAALGLSQLEKLEIFSQKRRENFSFLEKGILSSPKMKEYFKIVQATKDTQPSWFGFPLHCRKGDRLRIIKYLEKNKIGTRPIFSGNLTRHPALQGLAFKISNSLVQSDEVMERSFWIGIHPSLGKEELTYVLEILESVCS